MGRLGPLTSLALGRSPYDDVVPGEGPEDPRAPIQLYDERGRPVNPETRRINRDVIRSHNEVMQVIGVAEPEFGNADAQADAARKRHQDEEDVGRKLFKISGVLEAAGVWGVHGMRQRILLYKQYSHRSFLELYAFHKSQQSLASYFFSGLPSFLASCAIDNLQTRSQFLEVAAQYVKLHLDIFTFMQRVGIASPSAILPSWKFFVPGSSLSPISLPPFPASVSGDNIFKWLAGCVMGCMPFVGYWLYTKISTRVTHNMCALTLHLLPAPRNSSKRKQVKESSTLPPAAATTPSAVQIPPESDPRNGRDIVRDDPPLHVLEGQPQNEALPVGGVRRQSTISVRGDEFASDDEETEVVSATLISFDVEATESTDNTPGVWSAELRPNVADSRTSAVREPVYRETALYRLPPILAANVIGVTVARMVLAPYESQILVGLASLVLARRGQPLDILNRPGFFQACAWGRLRNIVGMELIFFFVQGDAWAIMMRVADSFRLSEEEWERRVEEEASANMLQE